MPNARQIFARLWFAKDEQMLVHDEVELKILCLRFPPLPVLCVVLGFDNFFFQRKTVLQASVENKMGERDVVLSFSCIANKNYTLSVWLDEAKEFLTP